MTDLREGVSPTTHSILDMADAILATDHLMPEDGKQASFKRIGQAIACARDPRQSGCHRRAYISLAAASLVAMANQVDGEADRRVAARFAALGYRR